MTPDGDVKIAIIKYAEEFNIAPEIIYGICITESNGTGMACRYEPQYKWLFKPEKVKPQLCSIATEAMFQKVCWGITETMGAVLREYGYTDWLPAILFEKECQIKYGAKHLSVLKKRFPEHHDYISAYNQGSPRKLSSGKYINQEYVDKVLNNSKQWKI